MTVRINYGCFYIGYMFVEANLHKICGIKLKVFLKTNNAVWLEAILSVSDIYLRLLQRGKGVMYTLSRHA